MSDAPEFDLLVVGAGMAGLSAAARAAARGVTVCLVEEAPRVGGSAAYAEFIWTAPSFEALAAVNPGGDPALGRALVDGYEPAIEWVRSLGVTVLEPVDLLGFGRGRKTDLAAYLRACEGLLREAEGCETLLGWSPTALELADGAVIGADLRGADGRSRSVAARFTLLASGGFAADPELRARHIHPNAREMLLRANPHSRGVGLRLGEAAGAAFGKEDAGFYGHLMPSGVKVDDPFEFAMLTTYHSEHGVLVNLDGERFIDETVGDQLNAIALVEQRENRCLLVTDERVHRDWMLKPYVEGLEPVDKFQLAYRRGARCATAEDLDEFAALPEAWGYPGEKVRDLLLDFNRSCRAGDPQPSRRRDATPLLDPPYYVLEVSSAITFTMGGLLIDPDARVLDRRGDPVPGLLAAGGDAGGLYKRAYAGGLAPALVFGLRAAETAVAGARRR
ncbi:MAG: FAD-binding protein [Solirubrobacterales bacterium]